MHRLVFDEVRNRSHFDAMGRSIAAHKATQGQSTLLDNRDGAIDVMLPTAARNNPLGQNGKFAARAFAAIRTGGSNQSIAEELHAAMPQSVRDGGDALKRIGALSTGKRANTLRKA